MSPAYQAEQKPIKDICQWPAVRSKVDEEIGPERKGLIQYYIVGIKYESIRAVPESANQLNITHKADALNAYKQWRRICVVQGAIRSVKNNNGPCLCLLLPLVFLEEKKTLMMVADSFRCCACCSGA